MFIDIDELKKSGKFLIDDDHEWGYQIRFINEPEYCGKFLVLENNISGSYHNHKIKKETFIVLCGEVVVSRPHYFPERGLSSIFSKVGGIFTISPGTPHEMKGVTLPCVILEISTHDEDSDTYRIEEAKSCA
jgi:mannose-6-phosphate isomerase-like protein (cupin superfamily)